MGESSPLVDDVSPELVRSVISHCPWGLAPGASGFRSDYLHQVMGLNESIAE